MCKVWICFWSILRVFEWFLRSSWKGRKYFVRLGLYLLGVYRGTTNFGMFWRLTKDGLRWTDCGKARLSPCCSPGEERRYTWKKTKEKRFLLEHRKTYIGMWNRKVTEKAEKRKKEELWIFEEYKGLARRNESMDNYFTKGKMRWTEKRRHYHKERRLCKKIMLKTMRRKTKRRKKLDKMDDLNWWMEDRSWVV